jgi:hypothetical protein
MVNNHFIAVVGVFLIRIAPAAGVIEVLYSIIRDDMLFPSLILDHHPFHDNFLRIEGKDPEAEGESTG